MRVHLSNIELTCGADKGASAVFRAQTNQSKTNSTGKDLTSSPFSPSLPSFMGSGKSGGGGGKCLYAPELNEQERQKRSSRFLSYFVLSSKSSTDGTADNNCPRQKSTEGQKRAPRLLALLLLNFILISCGGGGGGGGGAGTPGGPSVTPPPGGPGQPPVTPPPGGGTGGGTPTTTAPPSNGAHVVNRAITNLGIQDVKVIPEPDRIELSWRNPADTSSKKISGYKLNLIGWSAKTGGNQVRDIYLTVGVYSEDSDLAARSNIATRNTLPQPIDVRYTDDNAPNSHIFDQLNGTLYYETRMQIVYAGGSTPPTQEVSVQPAGANRVALGLNADRDGLIDEEDIDDDNDGAMDTEDDFPYAATLQVKVVTQTDTDGDGVLDAGDVDMDGDGLIEIDNADEFNATRNNLEGSSLIMTAGAAGDKSGCYASAESKRKKKGCSGYELTHGLDLVAAGYPNWDPIGSCTTNSLCPESFSGTFDGNGHIISNLNINLAGDAYGVGLFGAASRGSAFNDITLRDVTITSPTTGRSRNFGALLGRGNRVEISNVMVDGLNINAIRASSVGGLAGYNINGKFSLSSVRAGTIWGQAFVGGLMGLGSYAEFYATSVVADRIKGSTHVGGLIGSSFGPDIYSSYISVNSIESDSGSAGGLLGNGRTPEIYASAVQVFNITNGNSIGGLVGEGRGAVIHSSSVVANYIKGTTRVGGLVGLGEGAEIRRSVALVDSVVAGDHSGAIVGSSGSQEGNPKTVASAYWLNGIRFSAGQPEASNTYGDKKVGTELQTPASYTDIYGDWRNAWCDPATGEFTRNSRDPMAQAGNGETYRVWNFGSSRDFPVLTCFGNEHTPAHQRQRISAILDPDGDQYFGGEDIFPNDPTEHADTDSDTVGDNADNCLSTPNTGQANSDTDPLGDACDPVPNSNPTDVAARDLDGDGYYGSEDPVPSSDSDDISAGDLDGDRYFGAEDPLPNSAPGDVALNDSDGDRYFGSEDPIPSSSTNDVTAGDLDGDRYFGTEDNCPNTANPNQANADGTDGGNACDSTFNGANSQVQGLTARAGETTIALTWSNPSATTAEGLRITGIFLTRAEAGSAASSTRIQIAGGQAPSLGAQQVSLAFGASNTYEISGLARNIDYQLSLQIEYEDTESSNAIPGESTPTRTVTTLAADADSDRVEDSADNCPNTPNPSQANADGTGTEAGNACDDTFDGTSGQAQELAALAGVSNITLSWTNPTATAAEGLEITGIFLSRAEAGAAATTRIQIAGGSVPSLGTQQVSLALGADNTYEVTGLAPDTAYEFSLQLEYRDTESSNAITGESTPTLTATTLADDTDGDGTRDTADNCPNTPNQNQANADDDSFGDACDVDDDGDGLIEIATADEFNNIRYNLEGTGYSVGPGVENATSAGCPTSSNSGTDSDGNPITACNGYELIADIDLFSFDNWEPIGNCVAFRNCPHLFDARFEGNDHTISNLKINLVSEAFGTGLFGAAGSTAYFRNIRLSDMNITSTAGGNYLGSFIGYGERAELVNISASDIYISAPSVAVLGGLVGGGDYADISSSSVVADTVSGGSFFVGGLVGGGSYANISSSSVVADEIRGGDYVGGLVGDGNADISSSSVVADTVSGGDYVGSLVGYGESARISSSSVVADSVSGDDYVGGLVGYGSFADISSSSVVADSVSGDGYVGGLVGSGEDADISSSSVVADEISGYLGDVGGLLGDGYSADISSSSVVADTVSGSANVGGLVGYGEDADISSSLVLGGAINGTSHVGGIVGASGGSNDPDSVTNTYWLDSVRFTNAQPSINNTFGAGKTKIELQAPTSFTGIGNIYANWADAWCDPANGEFTNNPAHEIAIAGGGATYRAWDLGSSAQFPVLTCFGDRLTEATQHQKITEILDPDGDGILGGADAFPNDPSEHADTDADTVGDNTDNCVSTPNTDQANSDTDPLGDACDPVPNSTPADVAARDLDGDGYYGSEDPVQNSVADDVALGDPDGDRYFGSEDALPNDPTDHLDDDGDLVGDSTDNCPNDANPSQANADGTGTEAGNACDDTFDGTSGQAKELTALVGVNNITLSWNNPSATAAEGLEITGIFLSRAEAGSSATRIQIAGGSVPSLGAQSVSLALGADNTYEMSGLAPDTAYEFSLQLEYQDTESNNAITGESTPTLTVTTGFNDTDGDTIGDHEDNCLTKPNTNQANSDSDSYGNACDVDVDGDGLIEIGTHTEFNAIRYSMAGTSLISTKGGEADSTGCGGQAGISSCSGYELTDDISLAAHIQTGIQLAVVFPTTTAIILLSAPLMAMVIA